MEPRGPGVVCRRAIKGMSRSSDRIVHLMEDGVEEERWRDV
jgi:hypothetical protein